jgi:hypothetical protein
MAVVIDFDDQASLIVSWAMVGLAGGLDVEAGSTEKVAPLPELETEFDVSRSTHWSSIIGKRIEAVAAGWHVGGLATMDPPSYPETVGSIRLDITKSTSVTIALGAIEEDRIRYLPDSLVVFFDANDARAYVATHAG